MRKNILSTTIIIIAIILFFSGNALYILDITEQAVITQMGKPVRVVTEPGLKVKIPIIQKVIVLSKKLLEYDAAQSDIITEDKKILVIDNYCRWKIEKPLKFFLSVRSTSNAISRIQDIVYSEMRIELGKHMLSEIIAINRNEIMNNVTRLSREKAKEYGIYIDDVRIKRADLPSENEQKVYARMKSERNRIAKQYRSEGMEESTKIKARTDKEKTIIIAEAYRKVQEIKGKTDADVIKITAKAYNQDIKFYDFMKTLEIYNDIIGKGSELFLTTDSELFNVLMQKK